VPAGLSRDTPRERLDRVLDGSRSRQGVSAAARLCTASWSVPCLARAAVEPVDAAFDDVALLTVLFVEGARSAAVATSPRFVSLLA
jgi:hypothetical protein